MINVNATKEPRPRVSQGDIVRDVEHIESFKEVEAIIQVSRVIFPLIIVLTQDCDLAQSYDDLLSVLVAPLYNAEHVYVGKHLDNLGIELTPVPRSGNTGGFLRNNQRPRYHYLEFYEDIPIVPSVIDFKHYFSVNVNYLREVRETNYVCTVSEIFREDISLRFSNFLSRIGLPDLVQPPENTA